MPTPQTVRRWILTGSIAAVTMTGTIYGAGLKSKIDYNKERQRTLEAAPDDRIAQLETARETLVAKRIGLERKLAEVQARISEVRARISKEK